MSKFYHRYLKSSSLEKIKYYQDIYLLNFIHFLSTRVINIISKKGVIFTHILKMLSNLEKRKSKLFDNSYSRIEYATIKNNNNYIL